MKENNANERVLILAPVGQDALMIAESLAERKFETQICNSVAECCMQMKFEAGALMLTEEALEVANVSELWHAFRTQPHWSELPVIILTTGGESRLARLLDLAAKAAGSVMLLERPIGMTTLMRSVEVALNSRRRQYRVRALLEEQDFKEKLLRLANEELADRARQLEGVVKLRTAKLTKTNEYLQREIVNREQAEAARELLNRKLLAIQEEERRRIARELHDQMGQNLTAINLGIKSLLDAERHSRRLTRLLRPLQDLATQTARDLHRIALELRPAVLDDFGFVNAVRNLTNTWSTSCHIDVDFEAREYEFTGISSEIETTLYRIIQEALNNVAKHSGAKCVGLMIRHAAGFVQAIIEDDGRGFDTGSRPSAANGDGGLGLLGIQERLATVGGSLKVESAPGHGVTLIVSIPTSETHAKKRESK